jgi:hypothetical protein
MENEKESDTCFCECCEGDIDGDDMCHHDYHTYCRDCCESREPLDMNDLD